VSKQNSDDIDAQIDQEYDKINAILAHVLGMLDDEKISPTGGTYLAARVAAISAHMRDGPRARKYITGDWLNVVLEEVARVAAQNAIGHTMKSGAVH
jgi:hypothetical protein